MIANSFSIVIHKLILLEKGTEETEKFVEHSLQQLRDLPMLIPLEPAIDINNELSLSLPFNLSEKKYSSQGELGHIFIENILDYYRPNRRPPIKPISLTLGMSCLLYLSDNNLYLTYFSQ